MQLEQRLNLILCNTPFFTFTSASRFCHRVLLFSDRYIRISCIKFLNIRSIQFPPTSCKVLATKIKTSTIVRLGPVKLLCPSLPSKRCIGPRHQKKVVSRIKTSKGNDTDTLLIWRQKRAWTKVWNHSHLWSYYDPEPTSHIKNYMMCCKGLDKRCEWTSISIRHEMIPQYFPEP